MGSFLNTGERRIAARIASLGIAGLLALGATAASAADFLPPPPLPPLPEVQEHVEIGSGWYLRGDVGFGSTYYDKIEILTGGLGAIAAGATQFRAAESESAGTGIIGVGGGYKVNSFLRFDGTFEYRSGTSLYGREQLTFPGAPGTTIDQVNSFRGDLKSVVGLANVYLDLGTWCCITPYIGAGIGFAYHNVNGLTDNGTQVFNVGGVPAGAGTSFAYADSADKTSLAWALMAGVGYDVNSRVKLELGYRFLHMGDGPKMLLRNGAGLAPNQNTVQFKGLYSHDIRIGMRWALGHPDCCGSLPPPRPVIAKY